MTTSVHILILAAGRGTRMGVPKALMLVGGRPWWQVQRERLARVGLPQTWVVSKAVRSAIAGQAGAPERMVVADSAAPMFESVMAGVESLRLPEPPSGAFVLLIDVPCPAPRVWTALAASPDRPAIPSFRGAHGHPTFLPWGWVDAMLLSDSAARRPVEERRLDRLIAPTARIVATDDPVVRVNLNTPADVQSWLALARDSASPGPLNY